jgi:proteasome-associated ATPase
VEAAVPRIPAPNAGRVRDEGWREGRPARPESLGARDARAGDVARLRRELADATAANARLADTLRDARSRIEELRDEVERLGAAPRSYGTYLGPGPAGGMSVAVAGRVLEVAWSEEARAAEPVPGQQVLLNEALAIVGLGAFEDRGELMRVAELLDDGRVLVVGRGGEERVVHLAAPVLDRGVRAGDTLLVDARSGTAAERLERSEVEHLVLEEVPEVDWSRIGGLAPQVQAVRDAVELPFLHADSFRRYGLRAPRGILLYGPPGCGKTLIARAVARSLADRVAAERGGGVRGHFLNVKGPELLDKYVGETERQIRVIFQRARELSADGSPVVVFFDEMEALFRTRGTGVSTDVETTIVPQLLAEIDGVETLRDVIVIGASNREDMIDPALLRPGRLDVKIRIDRPDAAAGREILALHLTPDLPLDGAHLAAHGGDRTAAAQALVERTADLVYARVPATEFLEVTYAAGGREVLHLGDFSSGAMLESIVARAKRLAIKRELEAGGDGLAVADLEAAVAEELRENEDLPSSSNPDDWARISGRRGEPIIQIRTLGPDAAMRRRPVEARTPGQYL